VHGIKRKKQAFIIIFNAFLPEKFCFIPDSIFKEIIQLKKTVFVQFLILYM